MREIRAIGGRGLLALTCSLLLVFPPVSERFRRPANRGSRHLCPDPI